MRRLIPSLVLAAVVAIPADAQRLNCGSSPEVTEFQRELALWSAARARQAAAKGFPSAPAQVVDNVIVLNADDLNAPFLHPFDLEGRTLIFTRTGATGFRMRNVPLAWEEPGPEVPLAVAAERYAEVDLGFEFPFFDRTVSKVYASRRNGIFFTPPARSSLPQFGDTDLVSFREPVIAPLLTTPFSQLTTTPSVRVRKSADAAVVTWSIPDELHVQAVLRRDGEIVFSYEKVGSRVAASSVVITSGNEPWRTRQTPVFASTDEPNDIRVSLPDQLVPMLDLTRLTVSRIADLDLVEVRVTLRAAPSSRFIAEADSLRYQVVIGEVNAVRLTLNGDGSISYSLPGWGSASGGRIEGNDVVLPLITGLLGTGPTATVRAYTFRGTTMVDSMGGETMPLEEAVHRARTDFSSVDERAFDDGPIAEAFTLPILSVGRVWAQVKAADPSLTDNAIDGVAIYQNFFTDLVTYAGAYSTGGNSQSSGITLNDAAQLTRPRSPALMHMNKIGYGHNSTSRGASHVVLHELGHRWLLRVTIDENGAKTRALNPLTSHPAQYVDTRAAFKVYTDTDASVMGGGFFTDNGNGSFTSSAYAAYGYSWLDLYLMGLAAPAEVQPFFYLADSNPALGQEYYAPANQTYSAQRRDVTIEQVIRGTGSRLPAYPNAQRTFKVAVVLLADPSRPVGPEDIAAVREYGRLLETDFRIATSGRGEVSTAVVPQPAGPRRRAVRR